MAKDSIGLIELTSIASGYQTADAMLKAAAVDLLLSRSICSGKYMVMVRGDVSAVQAAVSAGMQRGAFFGDRFFRDSEFARGCISRRLPARPKSRCWTRWEFSSPFPWPR